MLGRVSSTVARQGLRSLRCTNSTSSARILSENYLYHQQFRAFSAPVGSSTARDAWNRSCYVAMDFTIHEDSTVDDLVKRFSAYDIGCLVMVDSEGDIAGVITERDLIKKIALKGADTKETKVKQIATVSANLVTASVHDELDLCMEKLLTANIRHLPLLDDENHVMGILSIKDLCKAVVAEKEEAIQMLEDFASGKGGHFIEG